MYLAEGGDSKKVLLVTAAHVLFPPTKGPDVDYARTNTSAPRRNVLLLGTEAFKKLVESIKIRINQHNVMVDSYQEQITRFEARADNIGATEKLKNAQSLLEETNNSIMALQKFISELNKEWKNPGQRILGHIARSPRITCGVGTEGFPEDYAVVELDSSIIENTFRGNVIDLGRY